MGECILPLVIVCVSLICMQLFPAIIQLKSTFHPTLSPHIHWLACCFTLAPIFLSPSLFLMRRHGCSVRLPLSDSLSVANQWQSRQLTVCLQRLHLCLCAQPTNETVRLKAKDLVNKCNIQGSVICVCLFIQCTYLYIYSSHLIYQVHSLLQSYNIFSFYLCCH